MTMDWTHILERARAIAASYDTPVTLRQLYYRLVAAELIPNSPYAYKHLSAVTAGARRAGTFPALVDLGRGIRRLRSFTGTSEARAWLRDQYHRDRTEEQPVSLYLAVEKAGIVAQLEAWFGGLGVSVLALGGYASQTLADEVRWGVSPGSARGAHLRRGLRPDRRGHRPRLRRAHRLLGQGAAGRPQRRPGRDLQPATPARQGQRHPGVIVRGPPRPARPGRARRPPTRHPPAALRRRCRRLLGRRRPRPGPRPRGPRPAPTVIVRGPSLLLSARVCARLERAVADAEAAAARNEVVAAAVRYRKSPQRVTTFVPTEVGDHARDHAKTVPRDHSGDQGPNNALTSGDQSGDHSGPSSVGVGDHGPPLEGGPVDPPGPEEALQMLSLCVDCGTIIARPADLAAGRCPRCRLSHSEVTAS